VITVHFTDGNEYTISLAEDDEHTVGWLREMAVDHINERRPTTGALTRMHEHYEVQRCVL